MTFTKTLLTGTLLWSCQSLFAEQWVVQVGAYRENASTPDTTQLKAYGNVQTTRNTDGLTIVSIGPYSDRDAAKSALSKVHSLVPDAYLRRTGNSAAETNSMAPDTATLGDLSSLTSDQRANVVYLDGKLHYKSGEDFVPLEEFLATQ